MEIGKRHVSVLYPANRLQYLGAGIQTPSRKSIYLLQLFNLSRSVKEATNVAAGSVAFLAAFTSVKKAIGCWYTEWTAPYLTKDTYMRRFKYQPTFAVRQAMRRSAPRKNDKPDHLRFDVSVGNELRKWREPTFAHRGSRHYFAAG